MKMTNIHTSKHNYKNFVTMSLIFKYLIHHCHKLKLLICSNCPLLKSHINIDVRYKNI